MSGWMRDTPEALAALAEERALLAAEESPSPTEREAGR